MDMPVRYLNYFALLGGGTVVYFIVVYAVKYTLRFVEWRRKRLAMRIVEAVGGIVNTLDTAIHTIRHDVTPSDEIILLIGEQIHLQERQTETKLETVRVAFHRADSMIEDRLDRIDLLLGGENGNLHVIAGGMTGKLREEGFLNILIDNKAVDYD